MQFPPARRADRLIIVIALSLSALNPAGCAYTLNIPADLANRIDPNLEFQQIQADPASHAGKLVTLGAQILILEEREEGTLMELLQLPTGSSGVPETDAALSQGRFMLLEARRLDPAVYQTGRLITVVGEVTGKKMDPIDRSYKAAYPYLSARFIHLWPRVKHFPNKPWRDCANTPALCPPPAPPPDTAPRHPGHLHH